MISIDEIKKMIGLVEEALRNGDYPTGHKCIDHQRLATHTAAKKLGIHRDTIANRLAFAKNEYGMEPDWSLHKKPAQKEDPDHIQVRKLKDRLSKAEIRAAAAERGSINASVIRESIKRLVAEPMEPQSWRPSNVRTKDSRR